MFGEWYLLLIVEFAEFNTAFVLETCITVQALTSNVSFLGYVNVGDNQLVKMCRWSVKLPFSARLNLVRADAEVRGKRKCIDHMEC
jgi:hypothetical protein